MFCTHCGKVLNGNEHFCSNCGVSLVLPEVVPPAKNVSQKENQEKLKKARLTPEQEKEAKEKEQRIRIALENINNRIREIDTTGLRIIEGENGREIWYPDNRKKTDSDESVKKEIDKEIELVEKYFYKPLFDEKSVDYCGISRDEFQGNSEILNLADKALNKKDGDKGNKKQQEKDIVSIEKHGQEGGQECIIDAIENITFSPLLGSRTYWTIIFSKYAIYFCKTGSNAMPLFGPLGLAMHAYHKTKKGNNNLNEMLSKSKKYYQFKLNNLSDLKTEKGSFGGSIVFPIENGKTIKLKLDGKQYKSFAFNFSNL